MKPSVEIRRNTYYDSVTLMLITKEIKKIPEVKEVLVGMGTELNKDLADNLGLITSEIKELSPSDFFVAVLSEENMLPNIVEKVDTLLCKEKAEEKAEYLPSSFNMAANNKKDANLVLISLPGRYAALEAKRALNRDMNVMIFSDNVSIEDEIELKRLGKEKGLLVMGPDCGTAIINHIPLCFANVIRKGNIGIVGASGTGTQEVTVLIDKLGGGVSQVIGTGGRDLRSEVGGIMMIEGLKALTEDPLTKVIVLISKPPAKEVSEKILGMVKSANKPIVVDFIGGDIESIMASGAVPSITLEDAAHKAVALSKGEKVKDFVGFEVDESKLDKLAEEETQKFSDNQKYMRALYTGGTLADEAMKLLSKDNLIINSNIPLKPENQLRDINKSIGHTCIDLGDDAFTVGKPHPMIDPLERTERLLFEALDDETAVVLMDFVLGYGSNKDPVGEMLPSITKAKKIMADRGKHLCIVGYICGTDKDPQGYENQRKKLEETDVIVMPSNAQAVRFVSKILHKLKQ